MLENSTSLRKYKYMFSFRKYIFLYQDVPNFADISISVLKISIFCQSNSIEAVLDIF